MAIGAPFHTSSSPTALCAIIVVTSYFLFTSQSFSFPSLSSSFQLVYFSVFLFHVLHSLNFLISQYTCSSMASFCLRKRREHTPSPSEGESSSGFVQGESQRVTEHPAFPLWDPWYTPSLFFPIVSHGETPPSPHAWVFSDQLGFANSAQVPDPREILDPQIR